MIIVADSNIPYAREFFSKIGRVKLYPGREINAGKLKNADILLVRTVTKVDEKLLEGTNVRFVATATIGCDHIDADYLKKRGIWFAHAAGSNANSVSEYVISALFALSKKYDFRLKNSNLGVIGVGNVGSRVVRKAESLGMRVLQNDPPLQESTGDKRFLPMDSLFEEADIITLHVPLTSDGRHPTLGFCSRDFFCGFKKDFFLINTSRGPVVDSPALHSALDGNLVKQAVIDVWENEPLIDESLLEKVFAGTPHIAGYSRDGKANATRMIFESACGFFQLEPQPVLIDMPPPETPVITISGEHLHDEDIISRVVKTAYDVLEDSINLKRILGVPENGKAAYFDALRNEYRVRREFPNFKVMVSGNHKSVFKLCKLGFNAHST